METIVSFELRTQLSVVWWRLGLSLLGKWLRRAFSESSYLEVIYIAVHVAVRIRQLRSVRCVYSVNGGRTKKRSPDHKHEARSCHR